MNMTLADKGPHQPPPRLTPRLEKVSQFVQALPAVISATHWSFADASRVDGADFYVGDQELGHIHLGGEVHIPFPATLRTALIDAGLAHRFPWGNSFVEMCITTPADAARAQWLFQLNYDRLQGTPVRALVERLHAHVARVAN